MEVEADCRERQGLGHMHYYGLQVECFGIPRPRPDRSIQTKEQGSGKLLGTHIQRMHKEKKALGVRRLLVTGLLAKSY